MADPTNQNLTDDGDAVPADPAGGAATGPGGGTRPGGAAAPRSGHDDGQRVRLLEAELARLQDARPGPARERRGMLLGAVLMVVGPVWIVVEYVVSHTATSGLQQRDALVGAVFGLALAVVGTGLFLRCSLGRLWRAGITYLVDSREPSSRAATDD